MPAYSTKSSDLKRQVAAILKTLGKFFDIHHVDVQCQSGGTRSDCCLFVVSLCMRKDPHAELYTLAAMREHLTQCFETRIITSFPTPEGKRRLGRNLIVNRKKVDVFCTCCFPWDKYDGKRGPLVQCVLCREWYHQNCLKLI